MQTTTKKPASVEILFLRHSKARVLVPSAKRFVTGYSEYENGPEYSRALHDADVIANEAKRWARR